MITKIDPATEVFRTSDRQVYPLPGTKCGTTRPGLASVSKFYMTHFHIPYLQSSTCPVSNSSLASHLDMIFVGLHLIAFPLKPDRCARREAQALVIQKLVKEQLLDYPDSEVVIAGDLNDYDSVVMGTDQMKPLSRVI
jgi:endonuclease/exonuclease/phosphatase family metal-dependent hydrolase